MSNYTKTTDFEAKDSLPTGDSGKIIRGAEFETEFDAISTAIATKADTAGPTFTGTLTFETISDGTIGVTAFVDEDNMASNSATLVPTQQSVKAYVDSQVTAQDLDFQADTGGALSIDLDSETLTFTGGTGVDTSGSGNAVTFAIDSTVATLTGSQTLTNKTLTSPDVNTPDIDGGTIDGTVIGGTTPAAVSATTVSATGNITVGGTVDGRDVATDGTKLDGIESGATADQTAAEIRTLVESATDSNVFTDADHTKLDGIEASADVTDTTNVTAAGALMDSELTSEASVKALNQGVATTDSPTFAGLTTTATVSFGDNDKAAFGAGSDLQIYHDGSDSYITDSGTGNLNILANAFALYEGNGTDLMIGATPNGAVTLSHNAQTKLATTSTGIDVTGAITADTISLGDYTDALTLGAGNDLSLYHDGTNSQIKSDTGSLILRTDAFRVLNNANSEQILHGDANGAVTAYYDNAAKLATTATGIDVTGSITTDGLTVDGATLLNNGTNSTHLTLTGTTNRGLTISTTNTGGQNDSGAIYDAQDTAGGGVGSHEFRVGGESKLLIAADGDISFYEDTGTTAKLFWDASAESLGIGTSSPDTQLTLYKASTNADVNYAKMRMDSWGGSTGKLKSIAWDDNGSPVAAIGAEYDGSKTNIHFHSQYNGAFKGTSDRTVSIMGDGNVGIGTSSPSSVLTAVSGASADETVLTVANDYSTADAAGDASGLMFQLYRSYASSLNDAAFIKAEKEQAWDESADRDSALTFGTRSGGTEPTERMRIDSNGSVGIGTSNTTFVNGIGLKIANATAARLILTDSTNGVGSEDGLQFTQSGTNAYFNLHENGFMAFNTNNTERMRIESDGNLRVYDVIDNIANTLTLNGRNTGQIHFQSGGTEKMRMDASGNFLVGKTSTGAATAGIELNGASDILRVARDGGAPLELNRITSDGTIVDFRKDNTTVGNIGTAGGDFTVNAQSLGVLQVGGASKYGWTGSLFYPITDNASDLGTSSFRFKDLYLSGLATTGDIYVGAGSATSPSVQMNDTNSGLFAPAGNTIAFSTAGGERMRLDSSGNLLVGKTSSNSATVGVEARGTGKLLASATSGFSGFFNRLSTDGTIIEFAKDDTTVGSIGARGGDVYLETGDTGIRMFDASNAIIPVGSTGVSRDAAIDLGVSNIRFKDLHLSGNINLSASSQINSSTAFYLDSDIIHFRRNNESESARIDSSGNLLVGQTSADSNSVGIGLLSNGTAYAVRDGSAAFIAHRKSSDGNIVEFLKDNTTVGSIGAFGSDLYIGTNDSGLRFEYAGLNAIVPFDVNSSAISDAATDLGHANARFKNLYLSGSTVTNEGVYFGSAVAANHLDDYEEGTWTGTLTGSSTAPSTAQTATGTYTKVGNLVTVNIGFSNKDNTGASGNAQITGLPFTCGDNVQGAGWNSRIGSGTDVKMAYIGSDNNIVWINGHGSSIAWTTTGTGTYAGVTITFMVA